MRALATTILRLLALVGKELIEVIRRPGALVSLVLGPFLIMAVFGLGYNGERRPARDGRGHPPELGPADRRRDLPGARRRRAAHPGGDRRRGGGRGRAWPMAAPTWSSSPRLMRRRSSGPASSRSSRSWSTPSTRSARTTPGSSPRTWPTPSTRRSSAAPSRRPRATSRPPTPARRSSRPRSSPPRRRPRSRTRAPSEPQVLAYFGPAVLALILQHLAVTLVALALVRERTSGVIELFRVAPVNAWEVIAGKVLTYMLIGGLIAAATVALLVGVFQIPMLGDPVALAGAIALVLLASLGIGLVIAVISDSERQAVQLSLLLLLASVFFSGFVLAISEFTRAGPGAGLPAPGHPRDPADAGHHAARRDDPDLGVRRTPGRSPWSPWRGAGSVCDGR